jgi:hypothetical protein
MSLNTYKDKQMNINQLECEVLLTDDEIHAIADQADREVATTAAALGYRTKKFAIDERRRERSSTLVGRALCEMNIKPFTRDSVDRYKAYTMRDVPLACWLLLAIIGMVGNFMLLRFGMSHIDHDIPRYLPDACAVVVMTLGVVGLAIHDLPSRADLGGWGVVTRVFATGLLSLPLSIAYLIWANAKIVTWKKIPLKECNNSGIVLPDHVLTFIHNFDQQCQSIREREQAELEEWRNQSAKKGASDEPASQSALITSSLTGELIPAPPRPRGCVHPEGMVPLSPPPQPGSIPLTNENYRPTKFDKGYQIWIDHKMTFRYDRSLRIDWDPFLVLRDGATELEYFPLVWEEPGFEGEAEEM